MSKRPTKLIPLERHLTSCRLPVLETSMKVALTAIIPRIIDYSHSLQLKLHLCSTSTQSHEQIMDDPELVDQPPFISTHLG